MDETTVRDAAEAHGKAVVAGDLRRAGSDLTPEAQAQARDVMSMFPKQLKSAEIVGVAPKDEGFLVTTRYAGDDKETTVASLWIERDSSPKLLDMKVV